VFAHHTVVKYEKKTGRKNPQETKRDKAQDCFFCLLKGEVILFICVSSTGRRTEHPIPFFFFLCVCERETVSGANADRRTHFRTLAFELLLLSASFFFLASLRLVDFAVLSLGAPPVFADLFFFKQFSPLSLSLPSLLSVTES
jgi:hypothetical protein